MVLYVRFLHYCNTRYQYKLHTLCTSEKRLVKTSFHKDYVNGIISDSSSEIVCRG